ncbi:MULTISPECIES: 6-hydroxymethylpterin diphosphokinase MptE-like protein [Pseudomonas]|uniref:6-hydroxymethylpterin diphosphokinase MptE-like protein n=1 Tax=Pseudomonas TaxID=286 RepID=UPI00087885DB|nr:MULTISPECIES: 6-hydroxymethylpterin diphosphokinase MptE-like protein [Pseudomonas]AOX10491.1 hypothetical protein Q5O_19585 [Pseudomonas putida JB]MCI1024062.1 DUF115 domain-containing protein [Pseudomonas putida]MDN4514245.1 DUF115 domain-containing protein [Pseudomonas sp. 2,4-D]SIS17946.1 Protein of unknown function DUF115 [Pseudomonas putida]
MKIFKSISSLKNREKGKRAFILANGPSILSEDLSLLKGEVTIGMNASTMLEEQHGFTTDYYVLSDKRFLTHPEKSHFGTTDLDPKTIRILREELREVDDRALPNKSYYVPALQRDGFSRDIRAGYFFGCTTTMLAIQFAYYLGIKDIYLLGCDLKYSAESPRFYKESNPQLEDSFTSIQIWNIANANTIMNKEGKRIVNCSKASFLRPYLDYEEFSSLFGKRVVAA